MVISCGVCLGDARESVVFINGTTTIKKKKNEGKISRWESKEERVQDEEDKEEEDKEEAGGEEKRKSTRNYINKAEAEEEENEGEGG